VAIRHVIIEREYIRVGHVCKLRKLLRVLREGGGRGRSLQRFYRVQLLWRVGEQRGKAYLAFVEGGRMRLDFVSLKNGLVVGLLRAWRGSRASNVQWGLLSKRGQQFCQTNKK
jgi:hypothetical protein